MGVSIWTILNTFIIKIHTIFMVYPTLKNVKSLSNCNKMELLCSTISLKTNTRSLLLGKNSINFVFPCKTCLHKSWLLWAERKTNVWHHPLRLIYLPQYNLGHISHYLIMLSVTKWGQSSSQWVKKSSPFISGCKPTFP